MPAFELIYEKHREDLKKLISTLSVDTITDRDPEAYKNEYEGDRIRRTKSVGKRQSRTINTYTYSEAKQEYVKSGTKSIIPAKLIFPFPKIIVRNAVHFLAGGRMIVEANETGDAFELFKKIWEKDLRMQSVIKKLARTCMSETKAAIIFYPAPGGMIDGKEALRLRTKILDKDSGEFYPHFDDYGDMDAFLYKFQATNEEGKAVQMATIYTAEKIYHYVNDNGWKERETEPVEVNLFGKIPVVYVEQKKPEWEDVAPLIDDYEVRISRLADTNDYFAEPLLKIWGDISKLPNKEDAGKVLQFDMKVNPESGTVEKGDAEYATWDHTPASIELELKTIINGIYAGTDTPNTSFNEMKSLNNVAERTLMLMFMSAFIKRDEKMELFGPMIQRCVNIVTAGIRNIIKIAYRNSEELNDIDINFTDILPSDKREFVETIVTATGGRPILSQSTGSRINPLTQNPEEEIDNIQKEEKNSSANIQNESFNL